MEVDNRLVRTFYECPSYQYRLKLIYRSGEARVGISTFSANKGRWNPGKKHFFMAVEEWNCFMKEVARFNENVQRGAYFSLNFPINMQEICNFLFTFILFINNYVTYSRHRR